VPDVKKILIALACAVTALSPLLLSAGAAEAAVPVPPPFAQSTSGEYMAAHRALQLEWSEAILATMGAPETNANILSMGYWMQNESGGLVGENNPVNTSYGPGLVPGEHCIEAESVVCLEDYPTPAAGLAAISDYLAGVSRFAVYAPIRDALKAGNGLGGDYPGLAGALSEFSGGGYSTIPDGWGAQQGRPELPGTTVAVAVAVAAGPVVKAKPAVTPPKPVVSRIITVGKGQTLESLSEEWLGTADRAALAHLNHLGTGAGLRTGRKLRI
jgi:hypothetical protein